MIDVIMPTIANLTPQEGGLALLGASLLGYLLYKLTSKPAAPLPPGPKGLPIIGNLLQLPDPEKAKRWEAYKQLSSQYGPLTYLNVLGQGIVIVNSRKSAMEMLEKKSAIYSDRPNLTFANSIGVGEIITLYQYGPRFKDARKMLAGFMGSRKSLERYHHTFEVETHKLLKRLHDDPANLVNHIRKTAGGFILPFVYGYHPKENNDIMVDSADRGMTAFSKVTEFGNFAVDAIPSLRFIPEWLPGGRWKATARQLEKDFNEMVDLPYNWVKKRISSGSAEPCFVSAQLGETTPTPLKDRDVKWASIGIWAGASDSSPSSITTLFLAMQVNPEAQRKAQAEIDAVIGTDRMPELKDRPNLPYVEALFKEVLRWQPVVRLAVPHVVSQDDIQDGYLIPKGTIIIGSTWEMMQDPEFHPDPTTFRPERFLATPNHEPESDPRELAFGFGRRKCPGMLVADVTIWLEVARILSVFNISKPVDAKGKEIDPPIAFTNGTVSRAEDFRVSIEARSEKARALINDITLNVN